MPQPMKSISQILNEILGGIDPMCTVRELAGVCDVTERTVSNWRNVDGTEPPYSKVKALSHYLISEYEYYGLAFQFMLPCNGRANGSVQDDTLSIYEALTDLNRAYRKKEKQTFETSLDRIKAEVKDLEAEGKQL